MYNKFKLTFWAVFEVARVYFVVLAWSLALIFLFNRISFIFPFLESPPCPINFTVPSAFKYQYSLFFILTLVVAMYFTSKFLETYFGEVLSIKGVRLQKIKGNILSFAKGTLAFICINLLASFALAPILSGRDAFDYAVSEHYRAITFLTENNLVLILFSTFLLAFLEEILFRKMLFQKLYRIWGLRKGILISAIFFALVHIHNHIFLIFQIPGGILLASLYIKERNLWAPLGYHISNNLLSSDEINQTFLGKILCTLILQMVLSYFLVKYRKKKEVIVA